MESLFRGLGLLFFGGVTGRTHVERYRLVANRLMCISLFPLLLFVKLTGEWEWLVSILTSQIFVNQYHLVLGWWRVLRGQPSAPLSYDALDSYPLWCSWIISLSVFVYLAARLIRTFVEHMFPYLFSPRMTYVYTILLFLILYRIRVKLKLTTVLPLNYFGYWYISEICMYWIHPYLSLVWVVFLTAAYMNDRALFCFYVVAFAPLFVESIDRAVKAS